MRRVSASVTTDRIASMISGATRPRCIARIVSCSGAVAWRSASTLSARPMARRR